MCLDVQVDGRDLFRSGDTSPLVPASLEKLLTGTVALEVLGADTTLSTVVRSGAAPHDGVVDGDLYLVGGGDPLLMTDAYHQHFEHPPPERTDPAKLADAVVAAGVKQVTGRVVGDDSRYDNAYYPGVWPTRYATEAEAGPASALTIDQGLDALPPTHDDKLPKEHPAANPPEHAAVLFTDLLQARGVAITSPPASGVAPDGAADVASLPSAPVSGLVAEMLRESDNTTAELLTREIGLHAGTGGTTAAGVAAITAEATTLGLPVDGTVQVDGSGLSDKPTAPRARWSPRSSIAAGPTARSHAGSPSPGRPARSRSASSSSPWSGGCAPRPGRSTR